MKNEEKKISRRDALKLALVGGTAVAAWRMLPGEHPSSGGGEISPHKWVMVIDLEKCIGCGYCTLACQANNDMPTEIKWTKVYESEPVGGEKRYLPMPCQHCEHAPCVDACPVAATYHRPDGIVMMDYDRCIGCRYCEVACPYGARSFNWEKFNEDNSLVPQWGVPQVERRPRGVVEKCSFCYQRIDRGLASGLTPGVDAAATPACVGACPVGARVFGDLNDPESDVSKLLAENDHGRLREDLGTEPRVYYMHGAEEVLG